MSRMKVLVNSVLFLALAATSALAADPAFNCGGSPNSSDVVFQLYPRPAEILKNVPQGSASLVYTALQAPGTVAQAGLNTFFALFKPPFGPFQFVPNAPQCNYTWLTNEIYCSNMTLDYTKRLCNIFAGAVGGITKPINQPLPQLPAVTPMPECDGDSNGLTWGQRKVNCKGAWDAGYYGLGVVVANIDTGVLATHDELKENMRPDYNWLDPYNEFTTPNDKTGHGTHTMGTICGKTLGIAPGAQWIACRGCNSQSCDQQPLIQCGQFLLCPDKNTKNCSTRPDVINNSWGGGIGNTYFNDIMRAWKKAGIAFFFSAGNDGANGCMSVKSPADGNWTDLGHLSVGSVDCKNATSDFSSLGPSQAADYMGGLGVQITVPGTNVKSAWYTSNNATQILSGTSMSGPHAAGAAAVVLSKKKVAPWSVYQALMSTAEQNTFRVGTATPDCNNTAYSSNAVWPNNAQGYGIINVLAATNAV